MTPPPSDQHLEAVEYAAILARDDPSIARMCAVIAAALANAITPASALVQEMAENKSQHGEGWWEFARDDAADGLERAGEIIAALRGGT